MTYQDFLLTLDEDCAYELEERAAIKEFDAGMSREEAERQAMEEFTIING